VTKRNRIVRLLSLAGTILFVITPFALAQTEDQFLIRVESNLVLVHTEVYDKYRVHSASPARLHCRSINTRVFYKLLPSEPFIPLDCNSDITIHDLGAGDFRVFEDGIEQKIESVRFEREASISARDNLGFHGFHEEWSYTPRAKWSTVDLAGWSPSPANYFYRIAYVPPKTEAGECRHIKVTVDRPRAVVYASDQYCYTVHPATDPLVGTKFGKQLESDLDSDQRAKIPLSLQASFFYTETQKVRIEIVLAFPWDRLNHEWINGDLHAMIGVVGVLQKRQDRVRAARFSDLACCISGRQLVRTFSYDPDSSAYLDQSGRRADPGYIPSYYEAQIDAPAGTEYDLRVVLSDGKKFGRAEVPLIIDSYDGKQLAISSVVLSKRFRNAAVAAQEAAAANLAAGYVPLVSKGVQITPMADTRFKRGDHFIAYLEVYEPLLSQQPKTEVQAHMRIFDAKTGEMKVDFPPLDATPYQRPGSTMIPIGDELVVSQLPKGDYRLEVQATDSAGRSTPWRTAYFTLE